MKNKRNSSKNRLFVFMFVLSLVLTVYGLYAYYSTRISRPYQLISAIAYGTIKNFFFSSPLGADADTSIAFELAKWLAPITTSALVLTSVTNLAYHLWNTLLHRLSKKHMVIFEKNPLSMALIYHLNKDRSGIRISMISSEALSDHDKHKLEKSGVAAYTASLKSTPQENLQLAERIGFSKAMAFVFSDSDDLNNFSDFAALLKIIRPTQNINCYIQCKDAVSASYFEDVLNAEKQQNSTLDRIDLIPFNQNELLIRKLIQCMQAGNGLLSGHFESLRQYALKKRAASACPPEETAAMRSHNTETLHSQNTASDSSQEVSEIDAALGRLHLLVLGCNSLTAPLLFHTANDLQLNMGHNTKITLLDRNAVEFTDTILSSVDALENALELNPINVDIKNRRQLANILQELSETSRISTILFTLENTMDNLDLRNISKAYFPNTSFALRNTSGIHLEKLLPSSGSTFFVFGDIKKVMTQNIFLRRDLDQRARAFHESYSFASEQSNMGSSARWNQLSQTKKDSSRSSAVHGTLKEEILRSYFDSDKQIRQYLQTALEEFRTMRNETVDNPKDFQIRFTSYLRKHPILDFLSRLEHRRWCNSYYVKNYRYGEEKDEIKLTHPCLIDDWQVLMQDGFFSCHPEYDLLSAFALFSDAKAMN